MKDYRLGNKLYELRKKKNLTQEDLALLLDVSDKAVSKWENGTARPTIVNLKKISKIFGISLDELISLDEEIEEVEDQQKITKIVLTGGPCGGKSTAQVWIENHFRKYGYKVIFVPETATELINGGVNPKETKSNIEFQNVIFDLQLAKERAYEEGAKALPYEKILMVFDRGIIDNKAYMSKKEFEYLLKSKKQSEVKLRDSYDAVFNLVTTAKGARDCFTVENNDARKKTLDIDKEKAMDEAAELDDRLIASWTGHPHFRIIDNSTDFETKLKRLLREISGFLGEPNPYEIERKFLIEMPDLEYLESLPNCSKVQIVQTYLKSNDNTEVRVRQRGGADGFSYYMTKKIPITSTKRIEKEKKLTQDEYVRELLNADPEKGQIVKDRYCLSYNNQYFEIDIYPFWKDKAIIEIELLSEDQKIDMPPFIKPIDEVTDDLRYRNSELAVQIKKGLKI